MSAKLLPSRISTSHLSPIVQQCRGKSTKSQSMWITRQTKDIHVRQRGTFRARSAFKLQELAKQYHLLRPAASKLVVDLGASPGSWSQVVSQAAEASRKTIVAVDLLPMEPVQNVHFIQGNFLDPSIQLRIRKHLMMHAVNGQGHNNADLVLSDMAGNVTGHGDRDEESALEIVKACFEFCKVGLRIGHIMKGGENDGKWRPGGNLVMKFFTYPSVSSFKRAYLDRSFDEVYISKPDACRKESAEMYYICKGWKGDILPQEIDDVPPEQFVPDDEL